MSAGPETNVVGDEFNVYMGMPPQDGRPARAAHPSMGEAAQTAPTERAAKRPNKKLLMVAGIGAVALAALGGFAAMKPKPVEPTVSPDVAAVIAKAQGPATAPAPAQATPPAVAAPIPPVAGAPLGMTASPADAMAAVAAVQQQAAQAAQEAQAAPVPVAVPAATAAPAPTAPQGTQAPVAAQTAPPAPAVAAPQAANPVAPVAVAPAPAPAAPTDAELAKLRRDLASMRAQRDRAVAEAAAAKRAGRYTVVSVLSDGVVVRNGAGHESIVQAGGTIGAR